MDLDLSFILTTMWVVASESALARARTYVGFVARSRGRLFLVSYWFRAPQWLWLCLGISPSGPKRGIWKGRTRARPTSPASRAASLGEAHGTMAVCTLGARFRDEELNR
eukprot:scaffold5941_cov125-Isochrysis_galbana.AAC.8